MTTMIERVARKLCHIRGYEPDQLEPGDDPYQNNVSLIDGRMPNGDAAHFMWRQFVTPAHELLSEMRNPPAELVMRADELIEESFNKTNDLAGPAWRCIIDGMIAEGTGV